MRYCVAALICAALLALALTWAALGPQEPLTDEDMATLTGTDWYSVLIRGQRSGYACVQVEQAQVAGCPGLRVTEDVKILISVGDQQFEAAKSQVTLFDALLRPASIEIFKNELAASRDWRPSWLVISSPLTATQPPRSSRTRAPSPSPRTSPLTWCSLGTHHAGNWPSATS